MIVILTPRERILRDILVIEGCWEWQRALDSAGYGYFNSRSDGHHFAHRVAYEAFIGPIPDGLEIDHLCRNRRCANPRHLEAVTHLENVQRGEGAKRSHCSLGHSFADANTYIYPSGKRDCRTCRKQRRERYADRKAVAVSHEELKSSEEFPYQVRDPNSGPYAGRDRDPVRDRRLNVDAPPPPGAPGGDGA